MELPAESIVAEGPFFVFVFNAGMVLTGTRPALKVRYQRAPDYDSNPAAALAETRELGCTV